MLSKSKVDRLGERLRAEQATEEDLALLDQYRRQVGETYNSAIATIRSLGLQVTGRPSKSTQSIVEKLRREHCRLSQVQDIAGARIVVETMAEQTSLAEHLRKTLVNSVLVDRRAKPSHGYRAVHVISKSGGQSIEVQVRTAMQHAWAELSEKLADRFGQDVKYGGGPANTRSLLAQASKLVAKIEHDEVEIEELDRQILDLDGALETAFQRMKVEPGAEKKREETQKTVAKAMATAKSAISERRAKVSDARQAIFELISAYIANPE
jgi:putative GTP pyrophosphokinase